MKRSFLALAALVCLGGVACQRIGSPPTPVHAPSAMLDFDSVKALQGYLDAHEPEEERESSGHQEDETSGRDLLEAWLFQLQMRAFPGDKVDWTAWARAAQARDRLPAARGPEAGWQFLGPTNLGVPYQTYFGPGPVAGRVNAVAFDPFRKNVLYACAAGGGAWKSVDNGVQWAPLSDGWPSLLCSSVAVGRDAVYVGTGDFAYPVRAPSLGLLISRNQGGTFEPCGPAALKDYAISRVLIDPDTPSVVTVSAGRGMNQWGGVWQSRDAGRTWQEVLSEPAAWCDVACTAPDPKGHRQYYAVGYNGPGFRFVYRSDDGGQHWAPVLKLGPEVTPGLAAVATSPVDPRSVYVLLGGLHQVWETHDAGAHWDDITGTVGQGVWGQDWYDVFLGATRQGAQDILMTGLIDVMRLRGSTPWQSVGLCLTGQARLHCDEQAVAVDPADPAHLLLGTDGGVFHMRQAAGDTPTFTSLNGRLGITQFYHAAFHPTDPNIMLGGTQDNSTPACQGHLDKWLNVGGGDGAFCAINPQHPQVQYASSQFLNIYETTDAWKETRYISPDFGADRRAFIAPFTLDPSHPERLYAGTDHLWRYDAGPRTWTPRLGGQKLSANGFVTYVAVAPGDGQTIYTGSNEGEVWMTRDGGANWTSISEGVPRRAITSIEVAPSMPRSIVVTVSGTGTGHVWRCRDTGAGAARQWIDSSGGGADALPDCPANTAAIDPAHPERLYVGTDVGVFASRDGGQHWVNATGPLGLPNVRVDDLELVPGTGFLNAATFGRGMWRMPIP